MHGKYLAIKGSAPDAWQKQDNRVNWSQAWSAGYVREGQASYSARNSVIWIDVSCAARAKSTRGCALRLSDLETLRVHFERKADRKSPLKPSFRFEGYCGSIGLPVTREADIYSDHGQVSDLGPLATAKW